MKSFGLRLLPAIAFAHDILMAAIAFALSMVMRLGPDFHGKYVIATENGLPVFIGVSAFSFLVFRLYRGLWRFASMQDLILVGQAVTLDILLFLPTLFYVHLLSDIPRSVPLITWFVLLILLGAPRFIYRAFKDKRFSISRELHARGRIPVILIGAAKGAEQFIRAMATTGAPYWVVGVLDDEDGRLVGRKIAGVTIRGQTQDLRDVVNKLQKRGRAPQRVVITRPAGEFAGERLGMLVDEADALGLSVGLMPSLIEFRDASAAAQGKALQLNPIAIEDLLGRPQTILDTSAVERLIAGRTVLITGAGGSIGSELCRQVAALQPKRLALVDQSEFNLYSIEMEMHETYPGLEVTANIADVREMHRLQAIFTAERPQIVFHAAALKHVPLVEQNPAEGVLTNTIGTRNVADAAREAGVAAMVMISTDKAVEPSTVMGASKRLAEGYIQALDVAGAGPGQHSRFMTVRFGNVLGSTGSVVPLFRRQIAAGGPVTVTHPDMERYFMTIREAVQLVLQASAHGLETKGGEGRIFVLDMGQPIKIVDLARRMIVLSGLRPDVDIQIKFTGIRAAEKLTERLFETQEILSPTSLQGVLSAAPLVSDLSSVTRTLAELQAIAEAGDISLLVRTIARLIPAFARLSDREDLNHGHNRAVQAI
jgi:O-antigen biosynthesis protein WbqV